MLAPLEALEKTYKRKIFEEGFYRLRLINFAKPILPLNYVGDT